MSEQNIFVETKLPEALSKEEVSYYFKLFKDGSLEAREKLIMHNIRFVIYQIFKRFASLPYDKNELISVGLIGLIKAVDTFDITKKYEFSSYAARCINNEILMLIRKNDKYLTDESLGKPILTDSDGNELLLEDTLADKDGDLEERVLSKELLLAVREQVKLLSPSDREIIKLYFGFFNNRRYSQKEISFLLGFEQSYISRTISKIIKNIRTQIKNQELIDNFGAKRKTSVTKQNINSINSQNQADKINFIYEYLKNCIHEYFTEVIKYKHDDECLTKNDCIEILTFIKTPMYANLLEGFSPKEAIIIAWEKGIFKNANYSINALAKFLKISEANIKKLQKKSYTTLL